MEENKDKLGDTSDDIDLALSFKREVPTLPPRQNGRAQIPPPKMPAKPAVTNQRQPALPQSSSVAQQRGLPVSQHGQGRVVQRIQPNNTAASAQPQKLSAQKPAVQPDAVKAPLPQRPLHKLKSDSTPAPIKPQNPLGANNISQVQGTSERPHQIAPIQRPQSPVAPKNAVVSNKSVEASKVQQPQVQKQPKPSVPQKLSAPKISNAPPTVPASAQPKKRGENDDFEIDEITYAKQKRGSQDSAFVDSATSAFMSIVKAIVYIVAIIAVSVGLAVFTINTANDIFKFSVDEKVVSVNIPEYATIDDIADILYDAGAIKYKWSFKLWSNLKDEDAEFIPGTYELSTSLNYDYLRSTFKKRAGSREEVRITIPEGYTVDEIIELFVEDYGIGTREGFVDAIQNYDFDYPFLEGLEVNPDRIYRLEGYLFPDTYNFYVDSSEVNVIKKLLDNFNTKFVEAYYIRCQELGLTVDEAIILASMVEKETRYADELGYVSSVFHNRLKYSATFPCLQSDATIMYAMQHDLGSRPDTMTGEDTEYETPYNTYTNSGLPPGPIANPGLNSIKYALYPNDSDYFYFVSDASGRTLFAKTNQEHEENKKIALGN